MSRLDKDSRAYRKLEKEQKQVADAMTNMQEEYAKLVGYFQNSGEILLSGGKTLPVYT